MEASTDAVPSGRRHPAADALDRAAVQRAVLAAGPDVIVHMLTAIPDPVDPRHLARDMALTNRLHTQGTANLLAAAGGLTRRLRAGRLPLIGDGPRCSPSSTPTTWPRRSWPPSSTRRPGGP